MSARQKTTTRRPTTTATAAATTTTTISSSNEIFLTKTIFLIAQKKNKEIGTVLLIVTKVCYYRGYFNARIELGAKFCCPIESCFLLPNFQYNLL